MWPAECAGPCLQLYEGPLLHGTSAGQRISITVPGYWSDSQVSCTRVGHAV